MNFFLAGILTGDAMTDYLFIHTRYRTYDFIFVLHGTNLQPTLLLEMEPKLNLKIIPQGSALIPL